MPETHENKPSNGILRFLQPPALYGVCALVLLGLAAFLFAGAYAEQSDVSRDQSASAASALPDAFDGLLIHAKAAIVVDLVSGETLYARNADAQLPLASITKVPLALAVTWDPLESTCRHASLSIL